MSSESDKKRRRDGEDTATSPAMKSDDTAPEPTMAEMKKMLDETRLMMRVMRSEINFMKTTGAGYDPMSQLKMRRLRTDVDSMSTTNALQAISIRLLEQKCEHLEDQNKTLEEKNEHLEEKCSSLDRSVQLLVEKEDWEYSAPPILTRHWENLGFDEDYIYGMEQFIQELRKETIALRRGVDPINISMCKEGYRLLYDDVLLPHWKEFANALQLYPHSQIDPDVSRTFSIYDLQLTSEVLDMLTPALKVKDLETFILERNEFANIQEGVEFAVKIIKSNPGLAEFGWVKNAIGSMDNVNSLLQALKTLPLIRSIDLSQCCGDIVDGYAVLRALLRWDRVSRISLSENNILTAGSTHIPDYLAANSLLKELDLDNNRLDDNDATLIAESLKQNTRLQLLSLRKNRITNVGWDALESTLLDSTCLNSVFNSNHTCYIEGTRKATNYVENRDTADPKNVRRLKIHSLLLSRHEEKTNAFHLNQELGDEADGYSLKLAPVVLECVQLVSKVGHKEYMRREVKLQLYESMGRRVIRKTNEVVVTPLSLVYELLRSWKVSELYEQCGLERKGKTSGMSL